MIIKGCSRAAPDQLGKHLLRTDTNERVEILELQSPTGDLTEALRDWQVLASGTRGTKGLYHVNIDPDARYQMTPEQWQRAVEVLEEKLGFQGQPRAVVLHEKHGREHIHVVWQRTDVETMTLRTDSHNYRKHEEASLALEQEFGHEYVPGKHAKRDRERQPEIPKAEVNHAEWQQAERSGLDARERKELVTKLYEQCDNGAALKAALEEQGYILAKGDRRDYVIVDPAGDIHSLGRQIAGVKAKDLRAFMADLNPEAIPTAAQARALQLEQRPAPSAEPPAPEQPSLSKEEAAAIERAVAERHAAESRRLAEAQNEERARTEAVLDRDIAEKMSHFDALQEAERERFMQEKWKQERTGLAGWLARWNETFRPEVAEADARRMKEAAETFEHGLEEKRTAYLEQLEAAKQRDLAELNERHEQQRREHDARREEDLTRYLREETEAKRLAAELEERRRQLEEQRTRDGPDWPPPRAR